jgi:hypothetical protein
MQVNGGGLTLAGGGHIKGGQTGYNTGTGFFMGYSGTSYKFSIGNPAGNNLTWDGSSLVMTGVLSASAINAVDTINIAGNAVTVPELSVYSGYHTVTNSYTTPASVSLTVPTGTDIQVSVSGVAGCLFTGVGAGFYIVYEIVKDGVIVWYGLSHEIMDFSDFGGYAVSIPISGTILDTAADGSSHTYALRLKYFGTVGGAGAVSVLNPAIVALAVKR